MVRPFLVQVRMDSSANNVQGNVGILIDSEGLVLCPYMDDANEIVLADGTRHPCKTHFSNSKIGLMILQVNNGINLTCVKFANTKQVNLGDTALVIGRGNPLTISSAVISEKNKKAGEVHFLRLDASLGPGLPAGIVIDLNGNFLGILPKASGVGLALPSDQLKKLIKELQKPKEP